jgi:hypothetical protein
MPSQKRPDELIGILGGEYQARAEPNFALAKAVSTHLALPGLRAFWPMSVTDYVNPYTTDIANGYDLTAVGAIGIGYDPSGLAPIAQLTGAVGSYLSRADGGAGNWADILGTEAYIRATQRGLSLGGWFWWSALPGAVQYLMAKDDTGANRQYRLQIGAGNLISFTVWAGAIAATSAAMINAGWNHCAGIYDAPSQTVFVELNGVITSGVVGAAPAALADTAAPFTIGADGIGGNRFTGYTSMNYLCASSLSSALQQNTYQQSRTLYNV